MRFSLSTVIMTLLAGPASAAVIRVPEDVGSIQDALDGARDGDTIIASAGEYAVQSPLRFAGKGVTLRSADGPQATRIRKERSGRPEPVFLLDAGETREAVIRGFAIENPFGPGIKARGASPTIEENWFPDCDGAAISCEGGSPRIAGGRVELSSGVYFKGCDAEVEALEIARCLGGISVVEGRLVARACRLTACDYDGLSARSAELRVERCLIAGNSGGGLKALSCTGSIVRTTITGNSAGGNPEPILGGGVHWEGGNLTIDQCIIFGNVGGRVVDVRLMAPLS